MFECERRTIPKFAEKEIFTSPSTENNKLLECLVSTRWSYSTHSYKSAWVFRRHIFRTISFTKPWPPHSPYLNPLDFFLWGYLKDRVYTDNLDGIKELKNNIKREIRQMHVSLKLFKKRVNIWSISFEVIVAMETEMECVWYPWLKILILDICWLKWYI